MEDFKNRSVNEYIEKINELKANARKLNDGLRDLYEDSIKLECDAYEDYDETDDEYKKLDEVYYWLSKMSNVLDEFNCTLEELFGWMPNEKVKKQPYYLDYNGQKHFFKDYDIKLIEVYHTELIIQFKNRKNYYYVWNTFKHSPYCNNMNEWESFNSVEEAKKYIQNNL